MLWRIGVGSVLDVLKPSLLPLQRLCGAFLVGGVSGNHILVSAPTNEQLVPLVP